MDDDDGMPPLVDRPPSPYPLSFTPTPTLTSTPMSSMTCTFSADFTPLAYSTAPPSSASFSSFSSAREGLRPRPAPRGFEPRATAKIRPASRPRALDSWRWQASPAPSTLSDDPDPDPDPYPDASPIGGAYITPVPDSDASPPPPPPPTYNYTPIPTTTASVKKRDASYIPRPPNAFILFRSSFIRSERVPGRVEGNHSTLSKIVAHVWKALPKPERAHWEAEAVRAQAAHRARYPHWRFRPPAHAPPPPSPPPSPHLPPPPSPPPPPDRGWARDAQGQGGGGGGKRAQAKRKAKGAARARALEVKAKAKVKDGARRTRRTIVPALDANADADARPHAQPDATLDAGADADCTRVEAAQAEREQQQQHHHHQQQQQHEQEAEEEAAHAAEQRKQETERRCAQIARLVARGLHGRALEAAVGAWDAARRPAVDGTAATGAEGPAAAAFVALGPAVLIKARSASPFLSPTLRDARTSAASFADAGTSATAPTTRDLGIPLTAMFRRAASAPAPAPLATFMSPLALAPASPLELASMSPMSPTASMSPMSPAASMSPMSPATSLGSPRSPFAPTVLPPALECLDGRESWAEAPLAPDGFAPAGYLSTWSSLQDWAGGPGLGMGGVVGADAGGYGLYDGGGVWGVKGAGGYGPACAGFVGDLDVCADVEMEMEMGVEMGHGGAGAGAYACHSYGACYEGLDVGFGLGGGGCVGVGVGVGGVGVPVYGGVAGAYA